MKKIYKKLLLGVMVFLGVATLGFVGAANLATNLTWCATNSGSINVSYGECTSLAYLYQETSGDRWNATGNWFSNVDLTTWAHPSGFLTGTFTITGGHITALSLNIGNLTGTITSGVQGLPYMTTLDLSSNSISSINLSQNSGLKFLNLSANSLTTLNVTMLTGLKILYIGGSMSTINITQNINLTGFVLNYSNVSYVDFSRNTGLQSISLAFNSLTGLDVSNLSALTYLEAAYQSGKAMRYTNFSGATSIYHLWLSDNGLTGINLLPIGGALSILKLDSNHLTSISLTGNTSVGYVNLIGNSLSALDLSHNTYLYSLFLSSGNTGLTYIDISHNASQLHTLDMSGIALTGFVIATGENYPSDLVVYFNGNALNASTLSIDQLWFLNHYYAGWGYQGIAGGGVAIVVKKDDCPNGDTSPTPYDTLCSGQSASSSSVGGGGGGGSSSVTPTATTGSTSTGNSIATGTISSGATTPVVRTPLTKEVDVYKWAFDHHITTLPLTKARLHDSIQRYEAAKMIVQFAENVMHTRIEHNSDCDVTRYSDYSTFDREMTENITKACDLGLMGWAVRNKQLMSSFRPFDTLSAEEFGIVVGRYLGESPSHPATSQRVDIMRFLSSVSAE